MSEELRQKLRALPDFPDELPEFDVEAAAAVPEQLFIDWLEAAMGKGLRQPHAFSLATATSEGTPSARMLILKGLDADGWHFASAKTSRKGQELSANPQAAMNFSWLELGRQVRLAGTVVELSEQESARDWQERPQSDGSANPVWQLYALQPLEVEFWQARHDRQHRRLFYRRADPNDTWRQST